MGETTGIGKGGWRGVGRPSSMVAWMIQSLSALSCDAPQYLPSRLPRASAASVACSFAVMPFTSPTALGSTGVASARPTFLFLPLLPEPPPFPLHPLPVPHSRPCVDPRVGRAEQCLPTPSRDLFHVHTTPPKCPSAPRLPPAGSRACPRSWSSCAA